MFLIQHVLIIVQQSNHGMVIMKCSFLYIYDHPLPVDVSMDQLKVSKRSSYNTAACEGDPLTSSDAHFRNVGKTR